MAERRMFTKKVTDDDNFMALSSSAQALYLHLSMSADDDGFCNQVSLSMFKAHASVQDLQALLEKRYIYQFENGVIVIKHWRMANALRKDRYTPTAFQEELARLDLKENGSYTWLPNGCQTVAERLPQDRIGEDSIGKDREGEEPAPATQIVELFNSVCKSLPKVTKLSDMRRRTIKARLKQYTPEDLKIIFEKAEASSFLTGENDRGWQADFDWIMKDSNAAKIMDGNYDNRNAKKKTGFANFKERYYDDYDEDELIMNLMKEAAEDEAESEGKE